MGRISWEDTRPVRVSRGAFELLRKCCGDDARIEYKHREGKYLLCAGGAAQVVQARTIQVLVAAGLLCRGRDSAPHYVASDRGRQFLQTGETDGPANNDGQ